jgi:hypothetical protein
MSEKTLSEQLLEEWFYQNRIEWRRIRVALTPGYRRPDYGISVGGKRCIIEVKEIVPNDEDNEIVEKARSGIIEARWVAPGKRLRPAIRSAEGQLRKFSARGFPTIICVFDKTASFHDEAFHVRAAMYGDETLHFAVPVASDTAQFMGSGPGRNAMLRRDERTTVSAVAVLRQHLSGSTIDLFHNPHAAVPIDQTIAAPFVRRQVADASDRREREGPSWFDVRDDPSYRDFFTNPDAAMERVVREMLSQRPTSSEEEPGTG